MSYKRVLILNFPKIALEAPPLAPALLSAICKKNNIDYDFIDCNLDFFQNLNNELKEEILGLYAERFIETLSNNAQLWIDQYFSKLSKTAKNYDLIAISVFSRHSVKLVHDFLKNYKSQLTAHIVIGGAGITTIYESEKFYNYLSDNKLIDFWVLGEGDVAFEDILLKKFPSNSINNTTFNNLEDFSYVPIPNFDKFKIDQYVDTNIKTISIEGSRGCVKKCTFCDIQNTWGKFKYKDGKKLANELLELHNKYDINHFWFNDSLINGSMKAFRDFISHLADNRKENNITWSSQAIVRPYTSRDEEDFKLLKDSGCSTLAVGVESLSESVRWHMGKKFTNEDLDRFLNLAQKYNISIFMLMIVGYPTETQKDFEESLKQLDRYQHLADDGTISGIRIGGTMQITPDLPIYSMRKEIGLNYVEDAKDGAVNWSLGENTLKKRVQWRLEYEDYARELGYNCADKEMHVEQTILRFLKTIE